MYILWSLNVHCDVHMKQFMKLWYFMYRRAAKAQLILRIYTVSPEPALPAHTQKRDVDESPDQKLQFYAHMSCVS